MSKNIPTITLTSSLTWSNTPTTSKIQIAGPSFFHFQSRSLSLLPFLPPHLQPKSSSPSQPSTSPSTTTTPHRTASQTNLLSLPDPSQYNHYEILSIPDSSTPSQIRQAFHKACLQYHPDKTGRDENDEVFLLVKAAFDTLSDPSKKRAYDSSLPFDESIPTGNESPTEFFSEYGPVFDRNLRFGVPQDAYPTPPTLGDDDTSLEDVHAFYDYWTKFESWRDFSLIASEILKHDVDTADGREEKRWMMKEIERKAKSLKKEEMGRITTLLERALAADPRLKRQKEKERLEKERLQEEKKRLVEEKERREKEERERLEEEQRVKDAKEKKEKMKQKAEKDKEKKALRKARQIFRKSVLAAFQQDDSNTWSGMEEMHDDVELLCYELSLDQITALNDALLENDATESSPNVSALPKIKQCATQTRQRSSSSPPKRNKPKQPKTKQSSPSTKPWTKEELSALAKAIKKFPPGAPNRWDTIANFVNHTQSQSSSSPPKPKSKEECISQYNTFASTTAMDRNTAINTNTPKTKKESTTTTTTKEEWTEEQDQQLQHGLATYPPSMEKNERWTSIAKCVKGKTKKECVQRFKAIREAIKTKGK